MSRFYGDSKMYFYFSTGLADTPSAISSCNPCLLFVCFLFFVGFCFFVLGYIYFFPWDNLMQSLGCFLHLFQFYCRIKSLMKNLQYLIDSQYMYCKLSVVRSCTVIIKKNQIQAFISTHSFWMLEEEFCFMAGVVK